MTFKPMLATDFEPDKLRFPYFASPKLDGIRCLMRNELALTRSLKLVQNQCIQSYLRRHSGWLEGMDGELIVGPPHGDGVYNRTSSGVMSRDGEPPFTFYIFDRVDLTGRQTYRERLQIVETMVQKIGDPRIIRLPQEMVGNLEHMTEVEEQHLRQGYEGIMLRHADSLYKQGRATVRENSLLKVKRFLDDEAEVIGWEERRHNANEATMDNLGHTKRSTHQANMVGRNDLGAWKLRGLPGSRFPGVEFTCGSGMTDAQREAFWAERDDSLGKLVKFKYFPIGVKDAPRFPIFLGFRDRSDT